MLFRICDRSHREAFAGVVQIDVALVGDNVDATPMRKANDLRQVLRAGDRARGIARRIQDDGLGSGCNGALDHRRREREAVRFVSFDVHRHTAGITNDVPKRNPVRHRHDDLVAMVHQHLHGVEQRLLAARRRDCLLSCVSRAEVLRVARGNSLAQFYDTSYRRVLGEVAMYSINRRLLDVLRRREMRLARAKINQVGA